jgi:DNA-directed RNA polymerase subunit RPC12/RpoP
MGWTKSECVACGASVDGSTCKKTNKMGYKCFDCGASGHLPLNHYLIQNGAWLAVIECPSCRTRELYAGSTTDYTGIASGSIRYVT